MRAGAARPVALVAGEGVGGGVIARVNRGRTDQGRPGGGGAAVVAQRSQEGVAAGQVGAEQDGGGVGGNVRLGPGAIAGHDRVEEGHVVRPQIEAANATTGAGQIPADGALVQGDRRAAREVEDAAARPAPGVGRIASHGALVEGQASQIVVDGPAAAAAGNRIAGDGAPVERQTAGTEDGAAGRGVTIGKGEGSDGHRRAAGELEDPRGVVAIDPNPTRQRGSVQGEILVQKHLTAGERDRLAGKTSGKSDGGAGRGGGYHGAQGAGTGVGGIRHHLRPRQQRGEEQEERGNEGVDVGGHGWA